MPFMEKQITEKMRGWEIDTNCGLTLVPGNVSAVYDWLATGQPLHMGVWPLEDLVIAELRVELEDYVEGKRWKSIEVVEGHFARMSAPGYMDCTEWTCFATVKEAEEYLEEHYGEDHEAIYQGQMS